MEQGQYVDFSVHIHRTFQKLLYWDSTLGRDKERLTNRTLYKVIGHTFLPEDLDPSERRYHTYIILSGLERKIDEYIFFCENCEENFIEQRQKICDSLNFIKDLFSIPNLAKSWGSIRDSLSSKKENIISVILMGQMLTNNKAFIYIPSQEEKEKAVTLLDDVEKILKETDQRLFFSLNRILNDARVAAKYADIIGGDIFVREINSLREALSIAEERTDINNKSKLNNALKKLAEIGTAAIITLFVQDMYGSASEQLPLLFAQEQKLLEHILNSETDESDNVDDGSDDVDIEN